MILTKYILQNIKSVLDGLSITGFLYIAPQTQYPFVTFLPVSIVTEYTYDEVIERAIIQVTLFDNKMDVTRIFSTARIITAAFNQYEADDGTYKIICTHKIGETGPVYSDKEHYYQYFLEFEFICQRDKT